MTDMLQALALRTQDGILPWADQYGEHGKVYVTWAVQSSCPHLRQVVTTPTR